jgi:hypothetical protein
VVEPLGFIGLLLFASTLVPFIARRLGLGHPGPKFFAKHHHSLALASLVVLFFHGVTALTGRHGWQWGRLLHGDILTGVISLLVMLAVVVLALASGKRKPFPRTHCWLVVLLIISVIFHI